MYAVWKARLLAYLRVVVDRKADQWIAWAGEQGQPIVEDDMSMTLKEEAGEVKEFSVDPRSIGVRHDGLSVLVRPPLPRGDWDGGDSGRD